MATAQADADMRRPSTSGASVDLSAVGVDNYVVAGAADHLCPWQNCYQSTQLLGGDSRFVLSTSGRSRAACRASRIGAR